MIVDRGGFVSAISIHSGEILTKPDRFHWISVNGNAVRIVGTTPIVSNVPIQTIKDDWTYLAGANGLPWLTIAEPQRREIVNRHSITRQDGIESNTCQVELGYLTLIDEGQAMTYAAMGTAVAATGFKLPKWQGFGAAPPRLTTQLQRDIQWETQFPNPPATRSGFSKAIGRPSHQAALQQDLLDLEAKNPALVGQGVSAITDIRVNQQQVNALGKRVGRNRPDLSWTAEYPNGTKKRFHVEYEGNPPVRGQYHTDRIILNDPASDMPVVRIIP